MVKRLCCWLLLLSCIAAASAQPVVRIAIDGAISPSSSHYLQSAFDEAKRKNAQLLLIELNTPGGLVSSMREMIAQITNSPIPVAVYVSPKGAHAASAGTYLTYAAHIAAMAPGTNIGAATPISMMQPASDANASHLSTGEQKARNDAKAYLKSLAQLRGRNAVWAEEAVDEAKSLSAGDALSMGVIDLVAEDVNDLLTKIDGRSVTLNGATLTLTTASAPLVAFEADWRIRLLALLTDPNIAYILLLIAIYGLFFEFINPGSLFPGVTGAIAGVMALYALNLLPFNYAGLLLMLLGIAFMLAEAFIAGFGILGIGGAVAFGAGSLLLFDAGTLGSDISLPLILAFSLVSGGFFIFLVGFLWRSRKQRALGGSDEMIDAEAEVLEATSEGYRVRCHGEIWSATSDALLHPGDRVLVTAIDGLVLSVRPVPEAPQHTPPTRS